MTKQKIMKNTPELTHALKNAINYLNIELNDVEYEIQQDAEKFENQFIAESNIKIGKCQMLIAMIENYLND